MGAPKKKWTAEEEAALEAGVKRHGAGKWQTILKDPDFSSVLRSRSNVDIKDKWRNINVTASGLGSREKARVALKKDPQTPAQDDKPEALSNLVRVEEKIAESKPHSDSLSPTGDKGLTTESKKSCISLLDGNRLESAISDAITTLNEPRGSDRKAIATYIEENYLELPNLKKLLFAKLKSMTSNGKLVKVKHMYKIAPRSSAYQSRTTSFNDKLKDDFKAEKIGARIFTQPEVDAELHNMRSMPGHEVAAAAAQAVMEAEAAIAEAERAAREAEAAEAEAEAAQIFAEAAMKACQKLSVY